MTEVPLLRAKEVLPRLGWLADGELDVARFEPVRRSHFPSRAWYNKPDSGGLWTCPLVIDEDGEVLGTAFSMYAYKNLGWDRPLVEVLSNPDARVVVCDGPVDAIAIAKRWPDQESESMVGASYAAAIDWVGMAAEVDVFFLTQRGNRQLHLPKDVHVPNFNLWDAATALFLHPTFTPGEQIAVPSAAELKRRADEAYEQVLQRLIQTQPEVDPKVIEMMLAAHMMGVDLEDEDD